MLTNEKLFFTEQQEKEEEPEKEDEAEVSHVTATRNHVTLKLVLDCK